MTALPSYMSSTASSRARAATRPATGNRPQVKQQAKNRSGKPHVNIKAKGADFPAPARQEVIIEEEEPVWTEPQAPIFSSNTDLDSESEWEISCQDSLLALEKLGSTTPVPHVVRHPSGLYDPALSTSGLSSLIAQLEQLTPWESPVCGTQLSSSEPAENIEGLLAFSTSLAMPTMSFVPVDWSSSVWSPSAHGSVPSGQSVADASTGAGPPEAAPTHRHRDGSCYLIGEGRLFSSFHESFMAQHPSIFEEEQPQPRLPTVAELLADVTSEYTEVDVYQASEAWSIPERPVARQDFYSSNQGSTSERLEDVISALEQLSFEDGSFAMDDILTGRMPPVETQRVSHMPRDPYTLTEKRHYIVGWCDVNPKIGPNPNPNPVVRKSRR